jgi:hypothetical protein
LPQALGEVNWLTDVTSLPGVITEITEQEAVQKLQLIWKSTTPP